MSRTDHGWRPARVGAFLVAALVAAAAARPLPAQDAPVTLKLEARPGEGATYRYEQQIVLRMPPEFGGDQRVVSRLVIEQRPETVDDASIGYLAEVKDVSVEMRSSPRAGELDFSRFKGQRFRMTVDRRGRLQEMTPVGDTATGVAQLQQSMRQVGFPILPPGPVRVGQSWVDTTRIDAAAMALPAEGEIVSVSRTTLVRLVRAESRRVAELTVETEFLFEPGDRAIPGMQVEVRGRRSDDVRFDVTNGRFLASEGTQDFEMTMGIPGATSTLAIEGSATSRAERLTGS